MLTWVSKVVDGKAQIVMQKDIPKDFVELAQKDGCTGSFSITAGVLEQDLENCVIFKEAKKLAFAEMDEYFLKDEEKKKAFFIIKNTSADYDSDPLSHRGYIIWVYSPKHDGQIIFIK